MYERTKPEEEEEEEDTRYRDARRGHLRRLEVGRGGARRVGSARTVRSRSAVRGGTREAEDGRARARWRLPPGNVVGENVLSSPVLSQFHRRHRRECFVARHRSLRDRRSDGCHSSRFLS